MPSGSSALLVVKSNNQRSVEAALRRWACQVGESRPEVRRIIWFGSRVNGIPAPGSDVDVCIVLSGSNRSVRDRVGDYLPFGFPVGIDLFPYTESELERLRDDHPSWYAAINSGIDLPIRGQDRCSPVTRASAT